MKKIIIPFITLVLMLSLFGCESSDTGSGPSGYKVTFNSTGGSAVAAQNVADGSAVTEPADPAKNYFVFSGWYTEEACINPWDFSTGTVTASITLYAKWEDQYAIGDTGPAGGYIFYINTNYETDGWRYMESSPVDLGPSVLSNIQDVYAVTSVEIGSGLNNTALLLAQTGCTSGAVVSCNDYSVTNGGQIYDDWFLPSRDELVEMDTNIGTKTGYADDVWASSTELSAVKFYLRNFYGNSNVSEEKTYTMARVRAVRRF